MGFYVPEGAYLRSSWYVLDLFIVVSFWVGVVLSAVEMMESNGTSAVRAARGLRTLKLLNSFKELRHLMNALADAVPYILTIASLLLFFFVLFGIMGVALFGGALTRVCEVHGSDDCSTIRNNRAYTYVYWNCSEMDIAAMCPPSLGCDAIGICKSVPYHFPTDGSMRTDENRFIGFDNILAATLTLFVVTTGDEWTAVSNAIQHTQISARFIAWPYFTLIIFLLSLITAELFTAVIAFAFTKEFELDQEDMVLAVQISAEEGDTFETEAKTEDADSTNMIGAELEKEEIEKKPFPHVPGLSPLCQKVVAAKAFELVVFAIIIINAACMAYEHFDGSKMVTIPISAEYVFLLLYTLELLIKLLAIGVQDFFSGPGWGFNLIDTAVVVSGFIGLLLDEHGSGIIRVLRIIFRSVRLLKVAKVTGKNKMVNAIVGAVFGSHSVNELSNLLILIAVSLSIASIVGMHMFGFECHTNENGDPVPIDQIPRSSYASFGRGLLTSFQIMTGEDWAMIMYHYMHCFGPSAAIYFCLLFIYTQWCLLAMFVAVILDNFELNDDEKLFIQETTFLKKESDMERPENHFAAWFSAWLSGVSSRHEPPKEFSQSSFGCIPEGNRFRQFCIKVVETSAFEWFIVLIIILSTASLAAEPPPRQITTDWFQSIDLDQTGVLSKSECTVDDSSWMDYTEMRVTYHGTGYSDFAAAPRFKIMDADNSSWVDYAEFSVAVDGLDATDGPVSALSKLLGRLDLFIFVIFWMELVLKVVAHGFLLTENAYLADPWNRFDFVVVVGCTVDVLLKASVGATGAGFVVLRVFRVLRPLRLVKHNPGMKVIVNTVARCIPVFASLLILVLLVMFVFAVLGVGFFAGTFWQCEPDDTLQQDDCVAEYGVPGWANPGYNFDSTVDALVTLFICSTSEGWVDVMNSGIDAVGIGEVPLREAQPIASLYFVLFMVAGNFFLSQLFVGVLVTSFGRSSGTALLTDAQMKWVQLNMLTLHIGADIIPEPKQKFRALIFRCVTHPVFEAFISVCIAINVLMMAVEHFPQPEEMTSMFEIGNIIFVCVFVVETAMKLTALGPRQYFGDSWCAFDFIVVLLSVVSFAASDVAVVQAARALRALRVLLLVRNLSALKTIFSTLVISIPPTLNIMCLLGLLMLVYGVLGIQLYGGLPSGPRINHVDNFDDIQTAMAVLFQVSTGQDFLGYMIELKSHGCRFVSSYFISYYITSVYLFLNIFIAALLENFEMTLDSDALEIKAADIAAFQEFWEKHCAGAARMPLKSLRAFANKLPGIWETPLADPFWYNALLLDLQVDVDSTDQDVEFGFRRIFLAISRTVLSDECQSLAAQVEKAAAHTRRMRQMASRLIAAALVARLYMLRVRKEPGLSTRQRFWRIMALQFARDFMIFIIVQRSKLGRLEAAEKNEHVLELADTVTQIHAHGKAEVLTGFVDTVDAEPEEEGGEDGADGKGEEEGEGGEEAAATAALRALNGGSGDPEAAKPVDGEDWT
jgi:hypothetical protein